MNTPLKNAMLERGVTCKELATEIDMPYKTLYNYMQGRTQFGSIGINHAYMIAKALRLDLNDVIKWACK